MKQHEQSKNAYKLNFVEFKEYLSQKIEFSCVENIDPYFKEYDGHEDEEGVIEFWKQTLYEYSFAVSFQFSLQPKQLVKQFTLFDRVPCGLPQILKVLKQRGILADRSSIQSGQYYQKPQQQGIIGWIASGIYSRTVGALWSAQKDEPLSNLQDPNESQDYVCVEFLDRQADQLLNWSAKTGKTIHSQLSLRKQLRKATDFGEDDLDLLICHLKFTGKIACEQIGATADPDLIICKLGSVKNKVAEPLTLKEKAYFALELQSKKLDTKVEEHNKKIKTFSEQIKDALTSGNRSSAALILKRKKAFEKQVTIMQGQQFVIDDQLLALETAQSSNSVFDTLSFTSGVNRSLINNSRQENEKIGEMMQGIMKDRDEIDQLSQQFSELGLEDEQELLRELENMESEQLSTALGSTDLRTAEQLKLDGRIEEWEQKLLNQLKEEIPFEDVKIIKKPKQLLLS